jgi:hypothetical protein
MAMTPAQKQAAYRARLAAKAAEQEAKIDALNAALAEKFGRRVIWIHGKPYPDPGDDPA